MVAVVANHLFGFPAGGFIGVDVFFVISGFLITGQRYRKHQQQGRSFADFYRRRVRRIFPISTVVILVTVAASFVIYLTVVVVLSLTWAIYDTAGNPSIAYFSSFTRTWELGVGALLAILAGSLSRIPHGLRPVLGWAGLLGIAASLVVVSDSSGFPAPWVALPMFSTALVIAAGTGGQQRFLFPLTNPVSGYLGNVSYSLYLWRSPPSCSWPPSCPPTHPSTWSSASSALSAQLPLSGKLHPSLGLAGARPERRGTPPTPPRAERRAPSAERPQHSRLGLRARGHARSRNPRPGGGRAGAAAGVQAHRGIH